jgi:hypothetical protein
LAAVACAALGSGCFLLPRYDAVGPTTSRYPSPAPTDSERRVVLHTRLIEQPAGNDYLTRGLWADATDPLPHELSGLLAANGFRVGVVSGVIPGELERLGTSEAAVIDSAVRTVRAGGSKALPVNGPVDVLSAEVVTSLPAVPRPLGLSSAECVLLVTADSMPDGRVRVRCEPQIRHGETSGAWRVNPDGTGFDHRYERPTEAFPSLTWELTLRRREVLVLGSTPECDARLGQAFFYSADPSRVRQRVLTVQAAEMGTPPDAGGVGLPAALAR